MRWVKNSMSKITITSQWNSSYPLYFFPIQLLTRMTRPQTFEQDVAFWKVFERFVRALILALDIEVILSQSPFMNKKLEINPRISLVMLGIQILGYCFPLISECLRDCTQVEGVGLLPNTEPYNSHHFPTLIEILDHST